MKTIRTWLAFLIIALALVSSAVAQPNLDLKTTIDVVAAAPRDVFESMSKWLGCKLVIAPEITQPVTMRLQNVTVRTVLTALSETLGCRWGIEGNVLHVEPANSAQPGPSNVVGGIRGGMKGGITVGVPGGVGPYVAGGSIKSADFMQWMGRKTPADFRFENALLSTIMNELGKVAGIEMGVAKSDEARRMTIDLGNRTITAALKAIGEQDAPNKPLLIFLTLPGKNIKVLISTRLPNKSQ